jgi:hypothetical protein
MMNTEDLLEASAPLQLEPGTTRFVDYPIPGVESYYAVIDTELFKLGQQVLVAGENTTGQGVVVPLEVSRIALPPETGIGPALDEQADEGTVSEKPGIPPARPAPGSTAVAEKPAPVRPAPQTGKFALAATPLPYLQLAEGSGRSFSIPRREEDLDSQTQAAISRILATTTPLQASQTAVVILPEDKDELPAGESASLRNILQQHLLTGDYAGAESKLQGFLNLRRSPYTEARVRFYLAQAYYFQDLYEEALLEFVLAQQQLYASVQPWLESCFRRLWERQ